MDWIAPLVMPALGLVAWAAVGSADALARDPQAWARAGYRRRVWGSQVAAGLLVPIVPLWTGYYFIRVKPRMVTAERELAAECWPDTLRRIQALDRTTSTVRIRPSIPVVITGLAIPIVYALLLAAMMVFNPDFGTATSVGIIGLYGALLLLALAVGRRPGVTLAADELVINGIRRRHLPWADVIGVSQQNEMGFRAVRIWTSSGKSYRLRAPVAGIAGIGRSDYERDFHRIGQWWLAHRPQES